MTGGNPFLTDQQQGKNSFLRYFLTFCLVFALTILSSIILAVIAVLLAGGSDISGLPQLIKFLINFMIYIPMLLGLWIGVRFIHGRKFISIITPANSVSWEMMLLSGVVWFFLLVLIDLVSLIFNPGNFVWNFSIVDFLPFFILAVVLVPIQSATEELLFRGYFMQGLGYLTHNSWFPVLLSSILFALLHMANPEVTAYGPVIMFAYYAVVGLFHALLTLRFLGVEAAIGIHVANNLYCSLILSTPDSAIQSPSFLILKEYDAAGGLISLIIIAVVYWLVMTKIIPFIMQKMDVQEDFQTIS